MQFFWIRWNIIRNLVGDCAPLTPEIRNHDTRTGPFLWSTSYHCRFFRIRFPAVLLFYYFFLSLFFDLFNQFIFNDRVILRARCRCRCRYTTYVSCTCGNFNCSIGSCIRIVCRKYWKFYQDTRHISRKYIYSTYTWRINRLINYSYSYNMEARLPYSSADYNLVRISIFDRGFVSEVVGVDFAVVTQLSTQKSNFLCQFIIITYS